MNSDSYSFSLGDRGLNAPEIIGFTDNSDGTYIMEVAIKSLDEGKIICSGKFTLVPNEYANSITNPLYYFSVSNVDISK